MLAAMALAATMAATDANHFDLACSGTETTHYANGERPDSTTPWSTSLSFDLTKMIAAHPGAKINIQLPQATSTEIVLEDSTSSVGRRKTTINRDDGAYSDEEYAVGVSFRYAGTCEKRPFSDGLVHPKF